MIINFYPECDNPEFEKAAKEYKKIWEEEGDKITKTIEKVSGLKFKEKIINATIYKRNSFSNPLVLKAIGLKDHKRGALVHELCHRLIYGNKVLRVTKKKFQSWDIDMHKQVNLILYDILVELYGKQFAKDNVDYEISLWTRKGVSPYKIAWDWALSIAKEERRKHWEKSLKK
jgi:hypothetical protein